MIKKPIYQKIAGFNYLFKPNSDKETNTLRKKKNAMNYNFYPINNF